MSVHQHAIPDSLANTYEQNMKWRRGLGGNTDQQNNSPLKENMSNRKYPQQINQSLLQDLSGEQNLTGSFFSQPRPITLLELQRWLTSHSETYENKDGDRWTAPPCTIGIFRRNDTGKIAGFLPCMSWNCEHCAPAMKLRLEKQVSAAFGDQKVFFLTLTVNPKKFDDKDILKAFARLRASLAHYGYFKPSKGHIYFWVKEFTPPSHEYLDGHGILRRTVGHVRHIHMLTNFFIPNTIHYTTSRLSIRKEVTLSSIWRKSTDDTSHQIKMVVGTESYGRLRPSYIFKYIAKGVNGETLEHLFQRRERRFGKSVGMFVFRPRGKGLCYLQHLAKPSLVEGSYGHGVYGIEHTVGVPSQWSNQHPLL